MTDKVALWGANMQVIEQMDTEAGTVIRSVLRTLKDNGDNAITLANPQDTQVGYTVLEDTDSDVLAAVCEHFGVTLTGDKLIV